MTYNPFDKLIDDELTLEDLQKPGVDVMLQKTTKDSSQSYTVATFELLPNSSLKEIK